MSSYKNFYYYITATGVALVGLFVAVGSVNIVAAMLGAGTAGEFALAVKIVDAIMAGASVAAIVGLLASGGLGAGVIATIRWAIRRFGRKKAIS